MTKSWFSLNVSSLEKCTRIMPSNWILLCIITDLRVTAFLCPRHSKNGGGALSVTPVRACVRASVRPSVRPSVRALSKFGVRSITFKRLHRFHSNLVCWYNYVISKHRSSLGYNLLIFDRVMGLLQKHSTKIGVRSITFERLHRFHSYLACWNIISKHRSRSIWVTIH